jgi:ribose 5-phosphate isomerase
LFHLLTAFPMNVAVPEIRSALRKDGPVITDLGNMIIDVRYILITISSLCFPQIELWS